MSHNAEPRYGLIAEGLCPFGSPLEIVDDDPEAAPYGICGLCGVGWRIGPERVDLVLVITLPSMRPKPVPRPRIVDDFLDAEVVPLKTVGLRYRPAGARPPTEEGLG